MNNPAFPPLARGMATVLALLLCACAQTPRTPTGPPPVGLELVAAFEHQVTGVTVSRDGRFFVNDPRWTEDAPVSVAEIQRDGSLRPYPDPAWNSWRNSRKDELNARDHWVCVQSVVADRNGNLWVLDPAAPAQQTVVPMGPKLVRIDLATNRVAQTIAFDDTVAPQGSYLNDVRISADGRTAYITDSGAKGAIVVVDLTTGRARRALDGHPSTQPDKGVAVKADGQVLRRPDGRGVEFAADGIAMSRDGTYLYWQAIKGRTLYRIPTAALAATLSDPQALASLPGRVETVGENGPADGLLMASDDRLYITAIEDNAVKLRDARGLRLLIQDARLRWPDTMAEGPDGALYVTTSRIQDMSWYKPGNPNALATQLYRLTGVPGH